MYPTDDDDATIGNEPVCSTFYAIIQLHSLTLLLDYLSLRNIIVGKVRFIPQLVGWLCVVLAAFQRISFDNRAQRHSVLSIGNRSKGSNNNCAISELNPGRRGLRALVLLQSFCDVEKGSQGSSFHVRFKWRQRVWIVVSRNSLQIN